MDSRKCRGWVTVGLNTDQWFDGAYPACNVPSNLREGSGRLERSVLMYGSCQPSIRLFRCSALHWWQFFYCRIDDGYVERAGWKVWVRPRLYMYARTINVAEQRADEGMLPKGFVILGMGFDAVQGCIAVCARELDVLLVGCSPGCDD